MVLQKHIRSAVSKLFDLAMGVRPDTVLNGGPAADLPDRAEGELLQAGRALLAEGLDQASGRLDYRKIRATPAYKSYCQLVRSLQTYIPGSEGATADRTAFWINLYNALMIDSVLQYGVTISVMRDPGIFRRAAYNVGGLRYSADDIEHGILRRNRRHPFLRLRPFGAGDPRLKFMLPTFDPRIHFALVCAANSCPPISFYSGKALDQQLGLAMRSFLDGGGLHVDHESRTLYLSKIFKWYLGDFGGRAGLGAWLQPWLDNAGVEYDSLKLRFTPYDWGLNQVVPAG